MAVKDNELKSKIVEHLEFLGYDISDQKIETGYLLLGKKSNKPSLMIRIFDNTTILTSRFSGIDIRARKSLDFYEILNKINTEVMSKWYYSVEADNRSIIIITEVDYYDYDKSTFGDFVDNFVNEVGSRLQNFDKFFI